jgi:leucyl-tRNA synthetase
MSKDYDHKAVEKKWQEKWGKENLYKQTEGGDKPKCYVLDMFPYPSGSGLHIGHPKGYIATDIYSRYKKMTGHNVLHPMGWDAFGLPAENYALKNKTHPKESTDQNIERFKEQLSVLGFSYDWEREVNTTDPAYYKWTQWAFLKMFEKGLAFESHEPINWCPECMTGLANEDLETDGTCERCGSMIEKKPLRQWVLKITDYADRLLGGLEGLDKWPKSIKESQKNWIGRSEGVEFICKVKDLDMEMRMYNSVPQTYMAETFTVIAPEHPLINKLIEGTEYEDDVKKYVADIKKRKLEDKYSVDNELKGIFTGRYIENFCNTGKDLPIWVAPYVLYDYGTGIVNASAHDQRDFDFAKENNIPLHPVMFPEDKVEAEKVRNLEYAYCKAPKGVLVEPEKFAGRMWHDVRQDIIDHLVENGFAERKVNYKLRDWVFSRQRYWGEPIPLIHCDKCGVVAVPEKDLPVMLPEVESYEPTGTGESPLAAIEDWVNTECPKCKGQGKRETNTMPQWAGSCWYYLRYMDPNNKEALVDPEKEKYWAPVDLYVGGAEHATRHLIYARFWHKFLFDIGVVSTEEPFERLISVGLIMAEDGRKMSKRWGNVVNPDDMVERFGADSMRVYMSFMGPFTNAIAWNTNGMVGARRFIERMARSVDRIDDSAIMSPELERVMHQTIKKVGEDIQSFSMNTAVSQMMIFLNEIEKNDKIPKIVIENFIKILSPFAPHICDEIAEDMGIEGSLYNVDWPLYDVDKIQTDTISIAIQVNGKVRDEIEIGLEMKEGDLWGMVLEREGVKKWTEGKEVKKKIYIKGKIINIVVV